MSSAATPSFAPRSASTPDWSARFWLLLAGVVVFRSLFILFFCAHADLAGDEAYYWDWGRRPDWCYYSKPPMIGWLMGAMGWLTNHSELGVRGLALALGTGTLAFVFLLARRLYDAHTGFWAAVLVLLTPAGTGLNLFLTIDAPLLFAWTAALVLFWHAAQRPAAWGRWLALGLVLAFGTLSKQMMLVFPLLMVLHAACNREDRALLRNPRLWVAVLMGAAALTPVLVWNSQHDWITLEHTKHHFNGSKAGLGFGGWLARTLEFPLLQAAVYSPVLWVALAVVLWRCITRWALMTRRERYLVLCSAPALVVFCALSLRQGINPNWPAVYYVPVFILLAAWFQGHMPWDAGAGWRRWVVRTGLVCVVLVHLLVVVVIGPSSEFWSMVTRKAGETFGPKAAARLKKSVGKLGEMVSWNEIGRQAGQWLDKVPRPEQTFVLTPGYRYDAAQLAFNMPQHPRVYRWEGSGQVMSQYEVWPGPEECLGQDALILAPGVAEQPARPLAPVIADCFERCEILGRIEVPLGDSKRVFNVYLGHRLLRWESPRAKPKMAPGAAAEVVPQPALEAAKP